MCFAASVAVKKFNSKGLIVRRVFGCMKVRRDSIVAHSGLHTLRSDANRERLDADAGDAEALAMAEAIAMVGVSPAPAEGRR